MKRTLFAVIIASILSLSHTVQAQEPEVKMNLDAGVTTVFVECNFRATTKILCPDFIRGFYSSYDSVIRRESNEAATLSLSVTDEAITADQVRYSFSWKSKDQTQVSDFVLPLILDQTSLDPTSMMNTMIKNAAKGLVLYLDVLTEKTTDGQIVVVYQPKDDGSVDTHKDGFLDRLAKSPLFFSADALGSYSAAGVKPYNSSSITGNTYGELGYSKEKYKIDLTGYYTNRKASIPTTSGYLSNTSITNGYNGLFVYSMAKHWSVAVIQGGNVDKTSNIDLQTNTSAGLEWSLVPFRSTQNKELAFRVGTTYNTLALEKNNDMGHMSEQYFSAFAKIYFYWVFSDSKVSLALNTGISQNLKYNGYEQYSAGGTLSYQVNRAVRLNFIGGYTYTQKSLTYPGTPDLSNALQVQQMNGQAGGNMSFQVGLDFTVGNSLRKTRDRRWNTN